MKCIPIFIGMEDNFDIVIDKKSCKELVGLKNHISKFNIPSGSVESNIFEQKGSCYHIPFNVLTHIGIDSLSNAFEEIADITETSEATDVEEFKERSMETPMDEFMKFLEQSRLAGAKMSFSEKQTFKIASPVQQLESLVEMQQSTFNDLVDLNGIDKIPENIGVSVTDEKIYRDIMHTGIELDLDIYQKVPERIIKPDLFHKIVNVCGLQFIKYLDFTKSDLVLGGKLSSYAVILGKSDIQSVVHNTLGKCFKDSYHVRFPGIRTTKAFKKFLIGEIIRLYENNLFAEYPDILKRPIFDIGSASNPAMLLGSTKATGTNPHEFRYLYKFELDINLEIISISQNHAFDVDPASEHKSKYAIRSAGTGRLSGVEVNVMGPPKYNLCYETSLCYEDPRGLIKKRNFDVKSEYKIKINELDNMSVLNKNGKRYISDDEISSNEEMVNNLTNKNHEAANIYRLLGILDRSRADDYDSWRKIIFLLARQGPEYLPLAIWFSMRCPEKFAKGGVKGVRSMWESAVNNKNDDNQEAMTTRILSSWAKIDDPKGYAKIQTDNVFNVLNHFVYENIGSLNEDNISIIIRSMMPGRYVTDSPRKSLSSAKIWYEFVYPEDEKNSYIKGEVYKWRIIQYPDTLDDYISTDLPGYIGNYIGFLDSRLEKALAEVQDSNTESAAEKATKKQQIYAEIKKNLTKTKRRLGESAFINNIIKRCAQKFYRRGFERVLDTHENYIGVLNGVLQLHPLKLIQSFHEIPISRCCGASYKPYDAEDPYIKEMENAIKFLFCNKKGEFDEESYEYVMMYLASSLDGRKKKPIFFLWLGEGGNGKSFLLEMHIQAMAYVVGNGYGNKINIGFFMGNNRDNGGGPDTEKMTMKFARFTYCSESDPGAVLMMRKIKEFTGGETISGNDKNEKQDQFRINSVFTFCTNHDPRLNGLDYGTSRRISAFRFKRTMKHDPDPNNPLESKIDERFIEQLIYSAAHKEAYLSIITKYYDILMTKYNGNLNLVPKKNIVVETQEYMSEQNYYSKYVYEKFVHIGKHVPTTKIPVKIIPMLEIITDFKKWYVVHIGQDVPNMEDIKKSLSQTSLNKFIVEGFGKRKYLHEHVMIPENGEFNMEEYIRACKEEAVNDLNQAELFDDLEAPAQQEPVVEQIKNVEFTETVEQIEPTETMEQEFDDEIENIELLDNIIDIQKIKNESMAKCVGIAGQEFIDDLDWD